MVAEFNNTAYDDVKLLFGGVKTNVPRAYQRVYGVESGTIAYTIPALTEKNNDLDGQIVIEVDDNSDNAPNDAGGFEIFLEMYDANYFINEDLGGAFSGPEVEDEDDARTRDNSATFTVWVSDE